MKKFLGVLAMSAAFLSIPLLVDAYDASPRCYHDLQVHFFRPELVQQALSMHHVPQSVWAPITQVLNGESARIPGYLRDKARKMKDNPLDPVFQPEVALALLEDTLLEVFSFALMPYMNYQAVIINQGDVQDMFQYIRKKQEKTFIKCFPHLEKKTSP